MFEVIDSLPAKVMALFDARLFVKYFGWMKPTAPYESRFANNGLSMTHIVSDSCLGICDAARKVVQVFQSEGVIGGTCIENDYSSTLFSQI